MEYKYPQIDRSTGYAWNKELGRFISFSSLSKSPRLSSSVQTYPTSTRGWRSPIKTINRIFVSLRTVCSAYILIAHSTFRHCIRNIVFLCSKKKMVWSNTTAVIAMMTNQLSFWNLAISKFIRNPVSQIVFRTNPETTIPISVSRPLPTSFSLSNVFPKLFFSSHYQIIT